jgi:hypothetical protein
VRRAAGPFALALLIACVVRLAFPFDGLYGQDAFAYFRFARAIVPHLRDGAPLPLLYWPRGYPAAVAALLPLSAGSPVAGQLVSALACAWAATATFLLARELQPREDPAGWVVPAVAGLCAGASGIALRAGQVVMADGLALGLAATALWCAARVVRTGRVGWLLPCAVATAWGAVTRWQIGIIVLPIGAALLASRRRPQAGDRLWWAAALAAAALIVVPQVLATRSVPAALGQHEWLQRWNPVNAFGRDFQTTEGHARYHFPVALFYVLRLAWPDALFPTVAILALFGAAAVLRARDWPAAALLLGWPAATWILISGIPYENPRFIWPALPSIAALAGLGFRELAARGARRGRAALAVGLGASLAVGLFFATREHARTVTRTNADRAVVAWVDTTVPSGASVWRAGGTLMAEAYGSTPIRDVYRSSPTDIPSLLGDGCPCYYLEDRDDIEVQWAGRPPQTFFEALRRDPGLTAVASRPPFVLYRINRSLLRTSP